MILMDYTKLVGKIAADKESKKLGRISRIESFPGKTIKKDVPYAMIVVQKFLQKTVVVPIEAEKVTKVEGNYVWFSITKSEFTEEEKRIRKIITEREIYTGTLGSSGSGISKYSAVDQSGLVPKRKERKR